MLKLRAMGTTNDLKWFKKIIDRNDVFHVIRMSEPLPMKQKLPEMKEKAATLYAERVAQYMGAFL